VNCWNTARLKELSEQLASFDAGQSLSPELFCEIQTAVDAALILLLEAGAPLPAFMLQAKRVDAARQRLGTAAMAALMASPLTAMQKRELLPLAAQLSSALDFLCQQDPSVRS
jgi:hypothetical protein